MATTIQPSIGAGALFTQQGQGTSPGYSAIDLRRSDSLGLQEGVYGSTDFMVVQKGSGANMSVDITMPAGGFACVQGDSVSGQGLYTVPVHSAVINEAVAAADATNPRIDSVILEVLDNVHDASGSSLARIRILTGTPNGTATLDNRAGAPTIPANALQLADYRVPALDTTIDNTQIRDRRKFARGAYVRIVRTANAAAGNDYTSTATTTGTATQVDATNLAPRVECSGAPLRVTLRVAVGHSSVNGKVVPELRQDGALVDALYPPLRAVGGFETFGIVTWDTVPSAASHLLSLYLWGDTGTQSLWARAAAPLELTIEEIVRQNTANNTTTTG